VQVEEDKLLAPPAAVARTGLAVTQRLGYTGDGSGRRFHMGEHRVTGMRMARVSQLRTQVARAALPAELVDAGGPRLDQLLCVEGFDILTVGLWHAQRVETGVEAE
jgi:hypothetical protein